MSKNIILVKFIGYVVNDRPTLDHLWCRSIRSRNTTIYIRNDQILRQKMILFILLHGDARPKSLKKNIYIYTYVKWLTWWTFFYKTRYILIKTFASHIREALQLILIHTTKRKCFLDKSILKNSVSITAQVFTAAEPADAIWSENNLI